MKAFRIGLFFILLIVSFFPQTVFSAIADKLITELLVTDNDTTYRYLYLYDSNGNKLLETKYSLQNEAWLRLTQTEWFYEGPNCTLQCERIWKNNKWSTSYEIRYDYYNGNLTNELHKVYDNGLANSVRKMDYFYTGAKLTDKHTFSMYNNVWMLNQDASFKYAEDRLDSLVTDVYENGVISNRYLLVNSYGNSDNLANQVLKQKAPADENWTNTDSITYIYNSEKSHLISQRNKIWNGVNSVWENSQMIDYEYDASNNLFSENYKVWESMYWKDQLRYEYNYEQQKLVRKSLLKPIYNKWRSLISIHYSDFDGNKANHVESKYDFWGGVSGEFTTSFIPYLFNDVPTIQKANQLQLNYEPIDDTTIMSDVLATKDKFPVYPNPSKGIFYLDTQNYKIQSWTILDMTGREMKSQNSEYSTGVIDISEFINGIYVLKVNCGDKQITQKLIKY